MSTSDGFFSGTDISSAIFTICHCHCQSSSSVFRFVGTGEFLLAESLRYSRIHYYLLAKILTTFENRATRQVCQPTNFIFFITNVTIKCSLHGSSPIYLPCICSLLCTVCICNFAPKSLRMLTFYNCNLQFCRVYYVDLFM